MKRVKFVLISVVAALLVACGGGGGGSSSSSTTYNGPTAAIQINQTNAVAVAGSANQSSNSMAGASSTATSNGFVGVVSRRAGFTHSALEIALSNYKKLNNMNLTPGNSVVGAIAGLPISANCTVSGKFSINVQDNDNSGTISNGDVLIISFSHCDDGAGTVDNGTITFSVTSQTGSTSAYPIVASFTVTFKNYSSYDQTTLATDSINGDITFSTTDDGTTTTGTMSGSSIYMNNSVAGDFLMTNYNISFSTANAGTSYSFSFNMTTASTAAGGSIKVVTNPAFTGTTGNPTAGTMTIYGADSTGLVLCSTASINAGTCGYVQMTAQPDGLTVQIVVDDDGTAGPNAPVTLQDPNNSNGNYLWTDL